MDIIFETWPWYVGGPFIALTLFLLNYYGKKFGISSNLETICSLGGVGKYVEFFKFDWRKSVWNLMFVLGAVIGGFIAFQYLSTGEAVALNPETVKELAHIGFQNAGAQYLPDEIFSIEQLLSAKGVLILFVGGLFIGFGARYAGGCTSGHAITGLSNLEIPSLLAVIGFYIGGLIMTWLLIPLIF